MSKAEEEANKKYNIARGDDTEETSGIDMQRALDFIDGYHQAEKDNELTWEDIREIYCITLNLREHLGASVFGEPLYQEVLKRFRDFKERKENDTTSN